MNNLTNIIKEREEEFDKEFPHWWNEQGIYLGKPTVNRQQWKFDEILNLPNKIKSFNHQSSIAIIEGVIEQMERSFAKSIDRVPETTERDRVYNILNENMVIGYNQALSDQISLLKKVLEEIKNK